MPEKLGEGGQETNTTSFYSFFKFIADDLVDTLPDFGDSDDEVESKDVKQEQLPNDYHH